MIKYSTITFLQDVGFFQNRNNLSTPVLKDFNIWSYKNVSTVFVWSLALNVLHMPRTFCVIFAAWCFCLKCSSWESACVPSGFENFKHTQYFWWLARYDWPVSAWVLMTLKTTQVEPILAPSYANFPQGHQRECHVPRCIKKFPSRSENIALISQKAGALSWAID